MEMSNMPMMKNTALNIRQQIEAVREAEIARVANYMAMVNEDATEMTRRYPILRRTMNSPAEDAQIKAFETKNISFP